MIIEIQGQFSRVANGGNGFWGAQRQFWRVENGKGSFLMPQVYFLKLETAIMIIKNLGKIFKSFKWRRWFFW